LIRAQLAASKQRPSEATADETHLVTDKQTARHDVGSSRKATLRLPQDGGWDSTSKATTTAEFSMSMLTVGHYKI
jgi:hypothetical protein